MRVAPTLRTTFYQRCFNSISCLQEGGYFFGTCPDAKRVNACFADRSQRVPHEFNSPMLTLRAKWLGEPQPFNSPFTCAIGDTVTQGARPTQRECILPIGGTFARPQLMGSKWCVPLHCSGHEEGSDGSREYLVYFKVLKAIAAMYGLVPVSNFGDPAMDELFDEVMRCKAHDHAALDLT